MNSESPNPSEAWKKCSSCKKLIPFRSLYWVCNVSTCNRKRTGLIFCSVTCWDAHQPLMNHRESWAEERKAPSREEWLKMLADEEVPIKRTRNTELEISPESPSTVKSAPQVIIRRPRR